MGLVKKIISLIVLLFLLGLLTLYWFIPQDAFLSLPDYGTNNFSVNESEDYNSDFSNSSSTMQFYNNMRYVDNSISYSIVNCPVDKKQEMISAMGILSSKTILNFAEVSSEPEIEISCENKVVESDSGLFIAGEGGPTNITILKDYNLITHGKVLLLKTSRCGTPDIALHELLHALGFVHSPNPRNIMYPVSNCKQELSNDIINTINELYLVDSSPDLSIEDANAKFNNHYLDVNITTKNIGFVASEDYVVKLSVNGNVEEELEYDGIDAGFGRTIILTNIFISSLKVENIEVEIVYNSAELQKDNNLLVLE